MIDVDRIDLLDLGLSLLSQFAERTEARGRFIALYLGLRHMGGEMAALGGDLSTPASDIEHYLDELFRKIHREEPYVVLTAPFGGSTSPTAPYSTRSGEVAPGHAYPTNTWRNNFGIQKGVGCPASSTTIVNILEQPTIRLACPHMANDTEGRYACSIQGTTYRGEEHSIWLRQALGGYQVVDLDQPAVFGGYLTPAGQRIPVFPLISVLYCASPLTKQGSVVGLPEFARDFRYSLSTVDAIFDCDPGSELNAVLLEGVTSAEAAKLFRARLDVQTEMERAPNPVPTAWSAIDTNSGLEAEIAVAKDLEARGWTVGYTGNQRSRGYDLLAERAGEILRVEVKSSVSFASLDLLPSEWDAAVKHGEEYVLAVVDFLGGPSQAIWYVRDPGSIAVPVERQVAHYVFVRDDLFPVGTEAEFL